MKKRFSTNGYMRTVILSIAAACIIEAIVNGDEVKTAFVKEKAPVNTTTTTIKDSTGDLLKVPQRISGIIGKVYYTIFS